MPFNLLLLPLLGGFVFISRWNRTRWHATRAEKERLLLYASEAGIVFLGIAILIAAIPPFIPCATLKYVPCLPTWWATHVPFRNSGVSVLALFIGSTVWWPLNHFWFNKRTEWARIVREEGGPLENTLYASLVLQKWVMITLKNGKVYIGPIGISFTPDRDKTIFLIPFKSGYREPGKHWVVITTDYEAAYERIKSEEPDYEEIIGNFGVVIPIIEILTASLHMKEIHAKYFAYVPPNPDPGAPDQPMDMD